MHGACEAEAQEAEVITGETITDKQIRALFASGRINADTAHEALNDTVWPQERAKARERCAAILNAEKGK